MCSFVVPFAIHVMSTSCILCCIRKCILIDKGWYFKWLTRLAGYLETTHSWCCRTENNRLFCCSCLLLLLWDAPGNYQRPFIGAILRDFCPLFPLSNIFLTEVRLCCINEIPTSVIWVALLSAWSRELSCTHYNLCDDHQIAHSGGIIQEQKWICYYICSHNLLIPSMST